MTPRGSPAPVKPMKMGMEEQDQQRGHRVGGKAMEPAHDAAAALRREITLNPGNAEDQHQQQHTDFDGIVKEKLHTAAEATGGIQPQRREQIAHQRVEPLHAQHLILEKQPEIHWEAPFLSYQDFLMFVPVKNAAPGGIFTVGSSRRQAPGLPGWSGPAAAAQPGSGLRH